MRTSLLVLAGLGLCLTACTHVRTERIDVRDASERAQECVAAFEPDGKAPQVMTYDSNTQTEVHMNQEGRRVDVTAQNPTDNTAMAMGGQVGGKIPEACTDADPEPGPAVPTHHFKTPWNSQQ